MRGIQSLVDEDGNKTAVLIGLKKHGRLWEDSDDLALAHGRREEPRESIASVKRRRSHPKRESSR